MANCQEANHQRGAAAIALHRLFARVFRVHGKHVFRRLAGLGITQGQPRILHFLVDHDGCIQRDISVANDLEPATVTNLLSGLERSGFVRREDAPDDRRVQRVYVTSKGRQALAQAKRAFAAVEEISFRGFAPEERAAFLNSLGRIYDNLKE